MERHHELLARLNLGSTGKIAELVDECSGITLRCQGTCDTPQGVAGLHDDADRLGELAFGVGVASACCMNDTTPSTRPATMASAASRRRRYTFA